MMSPLFCLIVAAISAFPQSYKPDGEFLIGVDGMKPYACTEEYVKAMREAHIDMFECMRITVEELDRFQKYGIGCYSSGFLPDWWGGDLKRFPRGKMSEMRPLMSYDGPASKIPHHPALWGLEVGDEPSALDFPHYGKLLPYLKAKRPELGYYVCLFPNYATSWTAERPAASSQLGAESYEKYICEWCRNVDIDRISTDIYPWGGTAKCGLMFENMRIIADAAQASGRTWDVVLQGNRYQGDAGELGRSMTANTMRFQANAALAYGTSCIWWGCWARGWWTENVIDEKGRMNRGVYEMFKTVNGELKTLGREYLKFSRQSTELVGFKGSSLDDGSIRQAFVEAAQSVAFSNVRAEDGAALAVGHMTARDGSGAYAMLIAACDDPEDVKSVEHFVTFKVESGRKVRTVSAAGAVPVLESKGLNAVRLRSNRAVLVIAESME